MMSTPKPLHDTSADRSTKPATKSSLCGTSKTKDDPKTDQLLVSQAAAAARGSG